MYSPFSHPDKVIARGSSILSSLLVVTIVSTYATADLAIRTGFISEYLIDPTQQAYASFVQSIQNQIEEDARAEQRYLELKAATKPQSGNTSVKSQLNTNNETTTRTRSNPTPQPTPVATPYPVIAKPANNNTSTGLNSNWEQEALDKQAQQQAEYDARVKEMNAQYEADVKQMKEDGQNNYDEAVAKQKAEIEAWKAENGF